MDVHAVPVWQVPAPALTVVVRWDDATGAAAVATACGPVAFAGSDADDTGTPKSGPGRYLAYAVDLVQLGPGRSPVATLRVM
jgi:hypothetical protein